MPINEAVNLAGNAAANTLEEFRTANGAQREAVGLLPDPAESPLTDTLELTPESLELSRLSTGADLRVDELSQPLRPVEDTLLDTETANSLPTNPATTMTEGGANPETAAALETGAAPVTAPETETALEAGAAPTTATVPAPGSEEEVEASASFVPPPERTPPEGAAEAPRAPEPPPEAREVPPPEEPPEPPARLEQLNQNAAAVREEAPVENTEIARETPRNEEQLLLQNVGSQLAQVVPPATIISVIG